MNPKKGLLPSTHLNFMLRNFLVMMTHIQPSARCFKSTRAPYLAFLLALSSESISSWHPIVHAFPVQSLQHNIFDVKCVGLPA